MLKANRHWFIPLITLLSTAPVIAEEANFNSLILASNGNEAITEVRGRTGGAYDLSDITDSDRHGNPCIGFGDLTPDHIMELEETVENLTLQVNSRGQDTTLLIQRPNGEISCGDDTGDSKDASITGTNWEPGEYKVWVGTFDAGQQSRYRLSAELN